MRAQTNAECGVRNAELGNIREARIEEIFLPEMTNLRANFARDVQMVIDDKPHARPLRDGPDRLCQSPHLVARRILGAQLDKVRAAIAKLLCQDGGIAPMQVGGVHERVETAIVERFHRWREIRQ